MTEINLNFEPNGTSFTGTPDGSLYSQHVGPAVAVNDGQLISSNEIRKSTISIYLKMAQHGTHEGDPASLLLFKFKFFSPYKQNRIKHASIEIEFIYNSKPELPHIYSYCPQHVIGDEVKRKTTTTGSVAISAGTSTPSPSANVQFSKTAELERTSRFTLQSNYTKTHSDGRGVNGVKWVLFENENSKKGIPDSIPIVLLVKRYGPSNFKARINIEAKISPSLDPKTWFGMFACVPKPIEIDVNTVIGNSRVDDVNALERVNLEEFFYLPDFI